MEQEQIMNDINNLISSKLEGHPELDPTQDLFNLGLDSLILIGALVELEEKYGVEFDDGELIMDNFSTIEKIYDMMKNQK